MLGRFLEKKGMAQPSVEFYFSMNKKINKEKTFFPRSAINYSYFYVELYQDRFFTICLQYDTNVKTGKKTKRVFYL